MRAGDETRSYMKNLASRVLNREVFMCPQKNFFDTSNETLQGPLDGACAELVTAAIDTLSISSLAVDESRNR